MSADHYSRCPACMSREQDKPIGDFTATEIHDQEWPLAHYEESYIDKGLLHFEFHASCRNCKYEIIVKDSWPLPKP